MGGAKPSSRRRSNAIVSEELQPMRNKDDSPDRGRSRSYDKLDSYRDA